MKISFFIIISLLLIGCGSSKIRENDEDLREQTAIDSDSAHAFDSGNDVHVDNTVVADIDEIQHSDISIDNSSIADSDNMEESDSYSDNNTVADSDGLEKNDIYVDNAIIVDIDKMEESDDDMDSGNTPANKWMWGITIDDPWSSQDKIVDSISSFKQKMTTRIVFDEFIKAKDYTASVNKIAPATDIMGLILDSFYVNKYTKAEYIARAKEYYNAFKDNVKIWELGNEVNGEWVGKASEVSAKIYAAYDYLKNEKNAVVSLTLYYNGIYNGGVSSKDNCWEKSGNQMFQWLKNIPDDMKLNMDYIFVSYYEDDCEGIQPDWQYVFDKLAKEFPNFKLGIGECGTKLKAKKLPYIKRYYQDLKVDHPRFIGGFFWWYGKQDLIPKTTTYWQAMQDAMNAR